MKEEIFDPEKHDMTTCPSCNARGFIQNPNRQCCPKCWGLGFIVKETDNDISTGSISKISLESNLLEDDRGL